MLVFAAWFAIQALDQPAAAPSPASPQASSPQAESKPTASATEVGGVVVTAPRLKVEPDWSKTFNFDAEGVYTPRTGPYLRERPVDRCKPMAGGDVGPLGRLGAAAGLVCAKRF